MDWVGSCRKPRMAGSALKSAKGVNMVRRVAVQRVVKKVGFLGDARFGFGSSGKSKLIAIPGDGNRSMGIRIAARES